MHWNVRFIIKKKDIFNIISSSKKISMSLTSFLFHSNDLMCTISRIYKLKNVKDILLKYVSNEHQKNIVDETLTDVSNIFEFYRHDLPSNNTDVVNV